MSISVTRLSTKGIYLDVTLITVAYGFRTITDGSLSQPSKKCNPLELKLLSPTSARLLRRPARRIKHHPKGLLIKSTDDGY